MKSFISALFLLLLATGATVVCSVYTDSFCHEAQKISADLPDADALSSIGAVERGEGGEEEGISVAPELEEALDKLKELSELWNSHRRLLDIFVSADYLIQADQTLIRAEEYFKRGYFSDYLAEKEVFDSIIEQIHQRETLSPENLY